METKSEVLHTIELNRHKFTVKCNVESILERLDKFRGFYDNSLYGYFSLSSNKDLTEEEYQDNISEFIEGFHKRISKEYVREIVKGAEKKKDGTFHKNRVYDEYPLDNAEEGSMGMAKYYNIRYKTVEDTVMFLELKLSTRERKR